jgi:hypothetical protein
MMKFIFFLIDLLLLLLFSSCVTYYGFLIYNEDISQDELGVHIYSDEYPLFEVQVINPYYGMQLKNIEYISGWIKIGDVLYTFKREEINISVLTKGYITFTPTSWQKKSLSEAELEDEIKRMSEYREKYYYDNRFNIEKNIIGIDSMGRMGVINTNYSNINYSEEEKLKLFRLTSHFLFFKDIEKMDIKLLYEQKNKVVEIFFEYKLIMENEIINVKINENFNMVNGKGNINLLNIEGN